MRNYTKPSAEVVELAVKEPVSLVSPNPNERTFGFGSKLNRKITLTSFATQNASTISTKVNG